MMLRASFTAKNRLPSAQGSGRSRRRILCSARANNVLTVEKKKSEPSSLSVVRSDEKGAVGWQQLVGLNALVAVICSVDRAAISVTILPMSAEFLWDDSTKGLISSAFFLGYTISNLVGGYVATKYPPGLVLATGVAVWSLFTIATPTAAAGGLGMLLFCRVIMGLGEGVTFPCIQNLVAADVPPTNKAQSLAIIYSGVQVGTIVSLLAAPLIIRTYDWPSVFLIFGAVGFVWLLAWLPLRVSQKNPAALGGIFGGGLLSGAGTEGKAEVAAREAAQQEADESRALAKKEREDTLKQVPWRSVLSNKAFLAVLLAHAGWGFGHTICYAWLPNFYYTTYGLSVKESAWLSALPWVCTVLVTNAGGYYADKLVREGTLDRLTSRKLFQALGSFLPAGCLMYMAAAQAGYAPDVSLPWAVGIMSAALALGGLTCSGFASNHQDLSARYAGILFGFTNAASSLSGTMSTYATGRVLDETGSWAAVFGIVAVVYAASAGV